MMFSLKQEKNKNPKKQKNGRGNEVFARTSRGRGKFPKVLTCF